MSDVIQRYDGWTVDGKHGRLVRYNLEKPADQKWVFPEWEEVERMADESVWSISQVPVKMEMLNTFILTLYFKPGVFKNARDRQARKELLNAINSATKKSEE